MILTANGTNELATKPGKLYVFAAQGNFGSGTLSFQWSIDGGTTWTTYSDNGVDLAVTASTGVLVMAPSRLSRVSLSGATNPSIEVQLFESEQ